MIIGHLGIAAALGTVLRVDFWLESEHINVTAVVRTCDPGVGNGIEFTGMPVDGKQRMMRFDGKDHTERNVGG